MAAKLNREDERQVRDLTHRAIKEAMHDALFSPLTLGEKHDIRVKPKFETACWAYVPPHRIYVGMGIVGKAKESLTQAQLTGYVKSHVRHEFGHAHFTERNMRKVKAALKEIDAPFQLFNLFEDARIEDRYRREADYQFEWLEYEDLAYSAKAESHLFALIQAEGDVERVEQFILGLDFDAEREKAKAARVKRMAEAKNPLEAMAWAQFLFIDEMGPLPSGEMERDMALERFRRVSEYYARLVAAETTADVYPVLVDWMEEFGKPATAPSMGCGGAPGEKSDLEMGAELAEDDDLREEFEADTEAVKDGRTGPPRPLEPDENAGSISRRDEEEVLQGPHRSFPVDLVRALALTQKLKKFFMAEARTVATTTPQRRVSARHFGLDRPYYRVKVLKGKTRQKLLVVVDCSGSMGKGDRSEHIKECKILIAALSRLAREGFIEGHVLLSAGSPVRWELFALPMADKLIARIEGFAGSEGLETTIRENITLAKDADHVFVYTDAQIGDEPINKSALHRYGVFTWGLYVGTADFHEKMQRYFDKDIIRPTVEALVDAMLIQKK